MKRRIKAGGKAVKAGRRKAATPQRPRPPKSTSRRRSTEIGQTEIARLSRDLKEALEQKTAMSEVLQVISRSAFDLQTVFDTIAENAVRLCEAERAFIFRFDGKVLRAVSTYNVGPELREFVDRNPIAPGRHSISARAAFERRTVHIPDVQADLDYAYATRDRELLRTMLAVPMLKGDELVGTITIYRLEVKPFTDKQTELVQNFAAQAVIAIENTRLLNGLRQRTDDLTESLEQQTATSEVLSIISSSPGELEPVFQTMLEKAVRICQATFGNIYRWDGHEVELVASHNVPPAFAEHRRRSPYRPSEDNALGRMIATKTLVHAIDAAAERAYTERREPEVVAAVELGGVRTYVAVPLLKDGGLIGVVTVYRKEVRPFTDKQIELLSNFAAQAVIAIENTRLLSELRQSLEQQTATSNVLEVISRSAFDLQAVFETVAESSVRLCGADRAFIFRYDGELLRMIAAYNSPSEFKEWVAQHPIRPGRHSGSARAALERRTIHIPDVRADPEYTYGAKTAEAIRTILGVPILKGDELLGVMMIYRLEVRPFTDKQIALVETFADQAAIAIENVRLFEAEQQRTRELGRSLEDLRTAQDRLVQTEKLASLGQLTAGIAHEIKNPLNFVNNFSGVSVELIEELEESLAAVSADAKTRADISELTGTLRGNLEKVVQHGKRADAIVKNMLLHSRQGSGEHRSVDINALVEESLNLAYHGARAEKQGFEITLERSFDPAAGEVEVFPQEITRALLNLISNGFYAATKRCAEANGGNYEPTLSAATKNLGNSVEIRIRDNGTGIPPEVREKLFNPFFTTKPAGEGTGLGLSICHDIIVKQHGGSIEVDTQLDQFTEFRIVLPRVGASR
jgi:two-component system, NtrC family, sensor kinase